MVPDSNLITETCQLLPIELRVKFRVSHENGLEVWVRGSRAGPELHQVLKDARVQTLCLVNDDVHDFILRPLREVEVECFQETRGVLSLCRDAEIVKNA